MTAATAMRWRPRKVAEAHEVPCSAHPGNHQVEATPADVWRCVWCRRSWVEIDATIRAEGLRQP